MKKCLKELARLKPRDDLELFNSKISFAGMNFKELVKDLDFLQKVEERQKTLEESKSIECLNCINFYEHYKQYQDYEEVSIVSHHVPWGTCAAGTEKMCRAA